MTTGIRPINKRSFTATPLKKHRNVVQVSQATLTTDFVAEGMRNIFYHPKLRNLKGAALRGRKTLTRVQQFENARHFDVRP